MVTDRRRRESFTPRSSNRRSSVSVARPSTVAKTLSTYIPPPDAMPIAATNQRPAAVVSPLIVIPSRRMAPAPRKPIPETTEAAMRDGSIATRSLLA